MTAIADATAMIETLIGRTVDGAELQRIGNSFVKNDPYSKGGWPVTHYTFQGMIVSDGGVDYSVDDILTVVGGTGTSTTVRVFEHDIGGTITMLEIETQGDYTVLPPDPLTFTGGTGTGVEADGDTSIFTVQRLPTNEEKAQLFLDTMLAFGRRTHRGASEDEDRETRMTTIDADVKAAGDVAVLDLT